MNEKLTENYKLIKIYSMQKRYPKFWRVMKNSEGKENPWNQNRELNIETMKPWSTGWEAMVTRGDLFITILHICSMIFIPLCGSTKSVKSNAFLMLLHEKIKLCSPLITK